MIESFYGGMGAIVLCRLFHVSSLVWVGSRMLHAALPHAGIYWAEIIIAATLFGIGHMPALAQGATLNVAHISRILGLNALSGTALGWLFWCRGLNHAMAAHFSADTVLHVAAPWVL